MLGCDAMEQRMLLIDEADDFLFDRRTARNSWERTMVNQMLRQMETLRAPFVATTNLADQLDPATRRRFTLQAQFRSLDAGRMAALLARQFGHKLAPGQMPEGLTPGDFALVAQRAALLGEGNPVTLLRWLRAESDFRAGRCGPIGF